MNKIRSKCKTEGCSGLGRNKGYNVKNERIWGAYCTRCHKGGKENKFAQYSKERFKNDKCERCGWNEHKCDRHRKIPELGYVDGNVVILCPNCHRLATYSIIKF